MENTLENKAKFFAQYWGQEVLINPLISLSLKFEVVPDQIGKKSDRYLLLKPLSSITDEDATIICDLLYGQSGKVAMHNAKRGIKTFFEDFVLKVSTTTFIQDYLRSKGYALPYMGLSVEKQIEYGWIKLT